MTWNDSQPYEQDDRDRREPPYRRDRPAGSSRQFRQGLNDAGSHSKRAPSSSQDRSRYRDVQGRSGRTYPSNRSSRTSHRADRDWQEPANERQHSSTRTYRQENDDPSYDRDSSYESDRSSRHGRPSRQNWQDDSYTQTEDDRSFQPLWQDEPLGQYRAYQPGQRSARNNVPVTRRQRLARWVKTHRALSIVLLACILAVSLTGVVTVVQMYTQYSTVHAEAVGGMKHLKRVQALLKPLSKQLTIPDPTLVKAVEGELTLAESDFAAARRDSGAWGISLAGHTPVVGNSATSAVNLVAAADDATQGGLALLHAVELAQPVLHAGFLAPDTGAKAPALSPAVMNQIIQDFETGTSKFDSAVALAQNADLSAIPESMVSASQRVQLGQFLDRWPTFRGQLQTVDSWLKIAPALLGITGPQKFLVELLDRGEMRSTGGFVGSYGILTVHAGQMEPFQLDDVFNLDTPWVTANNFPPPPAKYPWWPFAGPGLRDSNFSFDFPTSAQYGMQALKTEGGPDVQGVIAMTIPVIQKTMKVLGSVPLPQYGVTVTSDKLEELIRYYTETKAANVGNDLPLDQQVSSIHQRFTVLLGKAFMAKLRKASTKQLVSIAQVFMASMHTKELQVYLKDPAAEALLKAQGFDNTMARGSQDAITAVDSNVAVNKANLFITVNYTDAVTIDDHGIATHHLTITYNFDHNSNPPMVHYLYDRWYYRDYLRVYTPARSRLVANDGFNAGFVRLDSSDEPDRRMWGGYIWMAEGTQYSLHFTWTVPNAATQDNTGQWHYSLLFQHQAVSNQRLALTITMPGSSKPALTFNGVVDRDKMFTTP
jgi:hypothetical protein